MSQYAVLDVSILLAIKSGRSPHYFYASNTEAARLASLTGRKDYRIIDGRLSALKRSGKIAFRGKPKRWVICAAAALAKDAHD